MHNNTCLRVTIALSFIFIIRAGPLRPMADGEPMFFDAKPLSVLCHSYGILLKYYTTI